jgi:peroxiredoxin
MNPKRQPGRRLTIFITLIAGGIFILAAGLFPLLIQAKENAVNSAAPILPPVTLNSPAPELSLQDLQGSTDSLAAHLGEVVLVNSWATWCPPCKSEMPELQAYYAAHAADGFTVIAINSGDPFASVDAFVKGAGLTFTVWLDPNEAAIEAFQNWDFPSSYVIDRSGTMRLTWTGGVNQDTLEKYVTPLLREGQ